MIRVSTAASPGSVVHHDPGSTSGLDASGTSTFTTCTRLTPGQVMAREVWNVTNAAVDTGDTVSALPERDAEGVLIGPDSSPSESESSHLPGRRISSSSAQHLPDALEQRQGAICFTAVAAGAVYGITLSLTDRGSLHFVFGVIAVLMMLRQRTPRQDPVLGQPPQGVRTRKARRRCVRPILGAGDRPRLVGIRGLLVMRLPATPGRLPTSPKRLR